MKIRANGIDIEVEDTGGEGRPVVLLIMGLGMQLIAWPQPLIDGLVEAGYRVVRLDNRDIGLSQRFDALGRPNLLWLGMKYRMGFTVTSPYSLSDMAADALGVLDALHIRKAHVVGVSMGGMIAQRVALAGGDRVLSLTSIMSSSGARGLPQASPSVTRALLSRPAGTDRAALVDHTVKLFTLIGSPAFPTPPGELRERIAAAMARSYNPAGFLRQLAAIMADSARARQLAQLRCPTLVVHGKADPLVPFANGEDTARRIAGAKLVAVEGMGHDLPPGVVQRLLAELLPFVREVAA